MASPPITADSLWRWGQVGLWASLALALLLTCLVALVMPEHVWLLPCLLLGMGAVTLLIRRPLLHLTAVLSGFALMSNYDEGLQAGEVLYGVYYLLYLAAWFTHRLWFERSSLLRHLEDKAVGVLLLSMTASIAVGQLFGGDLTNAVREWGSSLMLVAFYFPVKEACIRYRKGPAFMIGVLVWLATYISIINVLHFKALLASVTQAWQIAAGRAVTNESILLIGTIVALLSLLYASRRSLFAAWLGAFLIFFVNLVLTQSRAHWLDFLFALALLFLLLDRVQKKKLLLTGLWSAVGGMTLLAVFFGDVFNLILIGLINRFSTLSDAASQDISLINRFFEYEAVWHRIRLNPVLGYGTGVPYKVWDLIDDVTFVKSFSHNGWLAVWYKYGLTGLISLIVAYAVAVQRSLRIYLDRTNAQQFRLFALIAGLSLLAVLPSSFTSVHFQASDTLLLFGIAVGLASGLAVRAGLLPDQGVKHG